MQSDITTAISGAFNLLGKSYAAWIATVTWNYAFLLLQRNGMRLKTLSAMISLPIIPELFPPPGTEVDPSQKPNNHPKRRRLSIGIALVMLSVFPASFSPPLLTGSITWRASIRDIPNADVVKNIGLGVTGDDINPWASWSTDNTFRPRFINRAAALATRAWNNVTDSDQDPPTFKRVIPSLQNLPVATSLRNTSVPWFNIESFRWITNGSDISTDRLSLVMFNSTPGVLSSADKYAVINPLQNSLRSVAILPDIPYASLNLSWDWTTLQPAKSEHQAAIVAVNINYAGECDSGAHTQFGDLPSGVYTNASKNIWGYSNCFVFAQITYSAGMATCHDCVVVFPIVVESPPAAKLTLEADIMTPHALYVMADVIGQLVDANVTLPPTWNNLENYTKEMLMRGYSGAWTAMSELFAFYTPYLSTPATIPITMSRAVVDHRRVWAWFVIQGLAFVGGVAFLINILGIPGYPIASPLLHGLMLDIGMSDRARQQAAEHVDSWAEDYRGTFIVWERGEDKSAFAIKGTLEEVRLVGDLPIINAYLCYCRANGRLF